MLTLLYSDASPFARATRIVARESGAIDKVNELICHPFNDDKTLRKSNPLGKIPCLLLPNGEAIFDSEVIGDFIDTNFNGGQLFTPVLENWTYRTFYSLINGLLDSAVSLRMEQVREEEGVRSAFWTQRFTSAINAGLEEVCERLETLPEEFTAMHITLACLLDYLDFRHPDINWKAQYPTLESWVTPFKERASFIETRPA